MNEIPIEIIIAWAVCLLVIVIVSYKIVKESKRNDDYFNRDDRIINDFYTRKKP